MAKDTNFRDIWLSPTENPNWSSWLQKVEKNLHQAKCSICLKVIELSNMGKRAIISHEKSRTHIEALSARKTSSLKSFLTSKTVGSEETPSPANAVALPPFPENASSQKLAAYNTDDVSRAEVLWALHCVKSKQSFRSQEGISKLFAQMFQDSEIASHIQLSRTKIGYLITFGLAPLFERLLKEELKNVDFFVACFDESMNRIEKKEQLDIAIRFWDTAKSEVVTRYWTSVFLGHTTADKLVNAFVSSFDPPILQKLVQASRDGPTVNWSFIDKLQDKLQENDNDPELLECGSCGLHTAHGAFKNGANASKWNLNVFLKNLHGLFKNSPAKREDFSNITGSTTFPEKFCDCRWLENSSKFIIAFIDNLYRLYVLIYNKYFLECSERAIEIHTNLQKYFKSTEVQKQLSKNFFGNYVETALKDPFLLAKLNFFNAVSMKFEPFLTKFQSSKPMFPFLHYELEKLLRHLMSSFVKEDVLKKANSASKLVKIDFKLENLKTAKQIDLGISTELALSKINEKEIDILHFRNDCRRFLLEASRKLIEKSPLKYKIVQGAECLIPSRLLNKAEKCKSGMKTCLTVLLDKKRITKQQAEKAHQQFDCFLTQTKDFKTDLKNFKFPDDRLDHCLAKLMDKKDFQDLWHCVKLILILSHGNAFVESGFSVNKEMLVENMHQETLVGLRRVWDQISHLGGDVMKIDINADMLRYARSSNFRYKEALKKKEEEKKAAKKMAKIEMQDKMKEKEELDQLKNSKRLLEKEIDNINTQIIKKMKK